MKERILRAFIEELRDNGMKFTMDNLAKRLGISKRTLYEHFSSKVEILETIIDHSLLEIDEKTISILYDDSLSLIQKIKETIMVLPTYLEFFDLRILEQMKRYYPAQWEKVDCALNDWKGLRLLIEQGIKEGVIKEVNVPLLIKLMIDATNITLDQRFFMENNITLSEALSEMADIFLFGLVQENKQ